MFRNSNNNYIPEQNNYIGNKEIEKETSLHDYINYGYEGLGAIYSSQDLPKEMYEFVISQFERFNVPVPPLKVIEEAVWDAVVCMNNWDPYAFFMGHSDVVVTGEWQSCTYEMMDDENHIHEIDAENIDSFVMVPDNDRKYFEFAMANPGLKNLIDYHHDEDGACLWTGIHAAEMLDEAINGRDLYDENALQRSDKGNRGWFEQHSPPLKEERFKDEDFYKYKPKIWFKGEKPGEPGYWGETHLDLGLYLHIKNGLEYKANWNADLMKNKDFVEHFETQIYNAKVYDVRLDYFRLGGWAAIVWLLSPMARAWRAEYFEIFAACYKDNSGECIMHLGNVYEKKMYNKVQRPPNSCYVCGLSSWCVDITMIEGTVRHLCEKHVNGHIPVKPPVNCGTRSCRHTECPHHVYFGMKDAKALVYRDVGMLSQKVKRNRAIAIASSPEQYQLLN